MTVPLVFPPAGRGQARGTRAMRVAFTSDLHLDFPENRVVLRAMVGHLMARRPDAFVLAGDLSHRLVDVEEGLRAFAPLSCPRLFVPGNHDVWILGREPEARSSREKYEQHLPRLAAAAGFTYLPREPVLLGDVAFVGTMGWYDYSFRVRALDRRYSLADYAARVSGFDLHSRWSLPGGDGAAPDPAVAGEMVAALKEQFWWAEWRGARVVVAVTHFVPFVELLEVRGTEAWDVNNAYMGSVSLGAALQTCPRLSAVIFGHAHRVTDREVRGVRAVARPLGYPVPEEQETADPAALADRRLGWLDA